jgi:hypothetical protein
VFSGRNPCGFVVQRRGNGDKFFAYLKHIEVAVLKRLCQFGQDESKEPSRFDEGRRIVPGLVISHNRNLNSFYILRVGIPPGSVGFGRYLANLGKQLWELNLNKRV